MGETMKVRGKDIAIEDLVPLRERNINIEKNRGFSKIVSSIKAVGLIEPLCVYRENGKYSILDGSLRHKACQQLGISKIPCLIHSSKEAYSYNRMVNRLSPVQETRMLRQALKSIDESTIADVFGMRSIAYRLGTKAMKQLHPGVIKALDNNLMSRGCAREFTNVMPKRQLQILKEMEKNSDYSLSFVRALVIKTPANLWNKDKQKRRAWARDPAKKQELVEKLKEVEKRHDFYTNLYRQYSTDLLKMCIYVRKLITNARIRAHLKERLAELLAIFERIVFETESEEAG